MFTLLVEHLQNKLLTIQGFYVFLNKSLLAAWIPKMMDS